MFERRNISTVIYWYLTDPKYSTDATSMITNLSEREVLAFICFRTLLKIHSCHNFPGFVCGAGVKVGAGVDKKYWWVFHPWIQSLIFDVAKGGKHQIISAFKK